MTIMKLLLALALLAVVGVPRAAAEAEGVALAAAAPLAAAPRAAVESEGVALAAAPRAAVEAEGVALAAAPLAAAPRAAVVAEGVALAAAPLAAAPATEAQVVVDEIVIDGGEGLSREVLLGALNIDVGAPMARSALDERILAGRQRLEAMALYASVDARLEKGAARNHYRLVLTTGQACAWYAGLSVYADADRTDRGFLGQGGSDQRSQQAELYAGSRALFGSVYRGELALSAGSDGDTSGSSTYVNRHTSTRAALFDPAIAGSPWFVGLNLRHSDERHNSADKDGRYSSESSGFTQMASALVGRRLGLFSASAMLTRLRSYGRYVFLESYSEPRRMTDKYDSYSTLLLAEARYSEKTGLVRLEPGLVAVLDMFRATAEHYSPPYTHLSADKTWLFGDMGVTGGGSYAWSYTTTCDSDRGCSVALDKSYDLRVTYEQSLTPVVVGGITFGYYADESRYPINPSHRPRVKMALGSTYGQFLVDLALLYGYPGMDRGLEDYLDLNHPRLTQ